MKKLFLVPTPIADDISSIPKQVIQTISQNKTFICERIRTSRRFIKTIIPDFNINESTFLELDKRQSIRENVEIQKLIRDKVSLCFLSEAGLPCIADPGAKLVTLARKAEYQIIPLSGPSSLMLALMSSGLNGQQFTFRGYLPVKKDNLRKELKKIEKIILNSGYTQLFIETPYRNGQLFNEILDVVSPLIHLNVSLHLHSREEYVQTKPIGMWKKDQLIRSQLAQKAPCIFILGNE